MYLDNFQIYKAVYLYFNCIIFGAFSQPYLKMSQIVKNSKLIHLSLFAGSGELTWTPCGTGAVL